MEREREALGFDVIIGGENKDDHSDYRPGIQAAKEFQIKGPLAECGITKPEVRDLAKSFGLICRAKPASPCLSSRIPYGSPVAITELNQVERAEALLDSRGFPVSRARHYGDTCKIEVPRERVADLKSLSELAVKLAEIGFDEYKIDDEGLVSGKLNRAIRP